MDQNRSIYGIDFSGAKDAGKKIWIARGAPKGKELLIEECLSASTLLKSGEDLLPCLAALVEKIKSNQNAVFGFDFPFGLPRDLVREQTWEKFVLAFPEEYQCPEAFREVCRQADEGHELKRRTDVEAHTPFSPYNLRLYKQTYQGISRILRSLVQDRNACILPFQEAVEGKPWILEVCPASTLKRLMQNRVPSYKGPEENKRQNRRHILDVVTKTGIVFLKDAALREKIITNKGGDALDSVIAALAAFNAVQRQDGLIPQNNCYRHNIEGYVYI